MMQEIALGEIKKKIRDQRVIDFQEDILRILKAVNEIDFINMENQDHQDELFHVTTVTALKIHFKQGLCKVQIGRQSNQCRKNR